MEFQMPPENDDSSQNESAPQYVTAEEIGNVVNAAVTAHLKRSLGTAIEAAMKPLTEKLQTLSSAPPSVSSEEDPTGKKSRSKQQDPELLAMAKKVEDMEKALADGNARVAAAEKKARDERAYNELRASLQDKVRPEFLDMVAKHLFVVEGRVHVDDAGTPLFKSQRTPWQGAEPEDINLPLKSGIEEFLKSDSAKPFLPAPATSSAAPLPRRGSTPVQTGTDFTKPATSDAEKARRSIERERMALDRLSKK